VSRDKRVAVTVLDGRDLGVWATDSGRRHCSLSGHDAAVRTVALSADGRVLVSGDEAGVVRVWETRDARCVRELSIPVPPGSLTSVSVSADGAVQVMAANDGSARVRANSAEHDLRVLGEASADYDVGLEMGADVTATLAADDRLVCVFDQWSWRLRVWDMRLVNFRRQVVHDVGSAAAWGESWLGVSDDGH
jgi:WD40 repeat protein